MSTKINIEPAAGPRGGRDTSKYANWLNGVIDSGHHHGPRTIMGMWDNAWQIVEACRNYREAYLVGLTMGASQKVGRALARREDSEYVRGLEAAIEEEKIAARSKAKELFDKILEARHKSKQENGAGKLNRRTGK